MAAFPRGDDVWGTIGALKIEEVVVNSKRNALQEAVLAMARHTCSSGGIAQRNSNSKSCDARLRLEQWGNP